MNIVLTVCRSEWLRTTVVTTKGITIWAISMEEELRAERRGAPRRSSFRATLCG
jgi:hypothetical protein